MGSFSPKSSAILAAVVIAVGCGSSQSPTSSGTFQANPYTTFVTDAGEFQVNLWTAPEQPPTRGINRVKLNVSDAKTDVPADDLTIVLVPWMPAMGHGASIVPTVTPAGAGVYIAENVDFFMPASWQLRISLTAQGGDGSAGVTDSATPLFDIP